MLPPPAGSHTFQQPTYFGVKHFLKVLLGAYAFYSFPSFAPKFYLQSEKSKSKYFPVR